MDRAAAQLRTTKMLVIQQIQACLDAGYEVDEIARLAGLPLPTVLTVLDQWGIKYDEN